METPRYDQSALDNSSSGSTTTSLFSGAPSRSTGDTQSISTKDSLLSYSSSRDMTKYLRHVDGRQYSLNETYLLPSDEKEWERLDKQHVAFAIGMKGLVPCPDVIDACLAPSDGITRRILDLGTGTGIWAIEMAQAYPHAQVVGVDAAPIPIDAALLPRNCRFEIDDVNFGLHHHYGEYDLVHARFIAYGIKNYPKMMEEVELCLRPGGLAIFVDFDALFCREDQISRYPMVESNEGGSWLVRCSHEMRNGAAMLGSDILGMEVSLDEGLWDHELMDPNTAQAASLFLPIGPWPQGQEMQFAGALIRQDYASAFKAVRSVYLKLGIPQEVIDEWTPKVEEELNSSELRMWSRTRIAWAQRRLLDEPIHPPSQSNYTLEEVPSAQDIGSIIREETASLASGSSSCGGIGADREYRLLHIYKTQAECLEAAKIRNESLGATPEPWCVRNRRRDNV